MGIRGASDENVIAKVRSSGGKRRLGLFSNDTLRVGIGHPPDISGPCGLLYARSATGRPAMARRQSCCRSVFRRVRVLHAARFERPLYREGAWPRVGADILRSEKSIRLLPMYLTGAALTVLATTLDQTLDPMPAWDAIRHLPASTANLIFVAFLSLTNLTMLFQEAVMFLAVHAGQVHWTSHFAASESSYGTRLPYRRRGRLELRLAFTRSHRSC